MAFERIPVAETSAAVPGLPMNQMREEREVDPYAHGRPPKKLQSGQINTNSDVAKSPEASSEIPEETVTLSPQMAALARKEQKFRQEQQELKKREKEIEAERAEIAELKALKAKLVAKDYSGIESLVKYDEYTQYLLDKDSALTPEQKALKELAQKVDGVEAAQKEDVSKRFEAAVNERRKAVKQLVESNPDYSSIKELKAEEAVIQHILQTWEHDQIDLSPEEAAKEVEKELIDRGNKWSALSKLKPKTETSEVADTKQLPPLKAPVKTLTNNMAATGEIKRPVRSLADMPDEQRYAEARRRAEEKQKQGIRI